MDNFLKNNLAFKDEFSKDETHETLYNTIARDPKLILLSQRTDYTQ
jgi:hypothetical protein